MWIFIIYTYPTAASIIIVDFKSFLPSSWMPELKVCAFVATCFSVVSVVANKKHC